MHDWPELEQQCHACTACPLAAARKQVVFGVGQGHKLGG